MHVRGLGSNLKAVFWQIIEKIKLFKFLVDLPMVWTRKFSSMTL